MQPKRYKFNATIEAGPGGGAYILFPYDVEKEFGTKGRVPVQTTFNGVPYTGSLVKYGHAQHMLGVLKSIRDEIGAAPGDSVRIELWRDEAPREVEAPKGFKSAMKKEGVLEFYEGLSYTHRKEYCRWISEAKKEETRLKRSQKAIEMLKNKVKTPDGAGSRAV